MSSVAPRIRLVWLDQVRGVGILLVVLGHAILSADRSGLAPVPAWGEVERAIYTFHMPLFFLLAGMTHALAGRRRLADAARGLFWTVVLPYLLWSAVWFALKAGFAGAANRPVEGSLVDILWQPVDHFWFLYVLLIVRAGWYLVDATGSRILRAAAALVPLAVALWGAGPGEGVLNVWLFFWAAFYGVGVLLAVPLSAFERRDFALLAVAALAVWLSIVLADPNLMVDGFDAAWTAAALAGSLCLLSAIALWRPSGTLGRWIALAGEASLTIFLTHSIVGAAVRLALSKTGVLTPETLIVAATVAGMVLPLAFHLAVVWATARTGLPLSRWGGLGGAAGSRYLTMPAAPAPRPAAGRIAG